jgi:predicted nucleotidyltransferase
MVNNRTKWSFLEPFLYNEEKIHLSEISRNLKISHTIVRRYLLNFEKEGILKKETIGKQTFYSLNKDFPLIIDILSIVEKERLLKICNKDLIFKEIIKKFHEINLPILIFGSSAKNTKKSNDLDILIVGKQTQKIQDRIKLIEKKLGKKIHQVNINSLNEINETLKKEIFSKHLIINSTELFLKWLH